jgi:hypothetical protein
MSVIIKGGSTPDLADVTSSKELKTTLTANPFAAGYVKVATTGYGGPLISTVDGHLAVSNGETIMFYDQVDGNAVNSNLWATTTTTQTVAQAGGLITLNNSGITTVSTASQITSIKQVPLYGSLPVLFQAGAIVNAGAGQANSVMELGFGLATGVAAPTDGVFFRFNAVGELVGVINYGGVETTTTAFTMPTVNEMANYVIVIDSGQVGFATGQELKMLPFPTSQPFPVSAARQPIFMRTYNTASAPGTAPKIQLGRVMVIQGVISMERDWPITLASLGRGAYQSPTAFTQAANHANSAAPTSATLSNTAAGYTTLGGRYQFAAVAGAATDYALFGYVVPTGYQLFITGLSISAVVTGAAIATTPTILDWSIGVNSSAVSLATADAATTWAPRRIPIGMQAFPLTAPTGPAGPGDAAPEINRVFPTPLVVDSGRYCHIILSMPVASATASQIIRGTVTINGYFE